MSDVSGTMNLEQLQEAKLALFDNLIDTMDKAYTLGDWVDETQDDDYTDEDNDAYKEKYEELMEEQEKMKIIFLTLKDIRNKIRKLS